MIDLVYEKPRIKIQPKRNPLPDMCYVEVTYNCNLKCKFCYNDKHRTEAAPSFKKIKKILKLLKKNGVLEITLTGGEFFTVKYWEDIFDYAKNLGFLIKIPSNGVLISQLSEESLAKIDVIGVSLHSADKGIYEGLTGIKGSFSQVVKSLKKLKKNNIFFGLMYTVTADNYLNFYSDIKDLICRQALPIRKVNINRCMEVGSAATNWADLSKINYQKVFDQIKRVERTFKIFVTMHPFPLCLVSEKNRNNIMSCEAGRGVFVVDWRGDVRLCPIDPRVIGNIFSAPLKKIFNSPLWINLRENKWLPEKCANCEYLGKRCNGGCYMSSKQNKTDEIAPDYLLAQNTKFELNYEC